MFSLSTLHSLDLGCNCRFFFSLSHDFFKLLSTSYKSDIPGNSLISRAILSLGTFDFMERECCMCFLMTWSVKSFQ